MRRLVQAPGIGWVGGRPKRGAVVGGASAPFSARLSGSTNDAQESLEDNSVSVVGGTLEMGGFTGVVTPNVVGLRWETTLSQGDTIWFSQVDLTSRNGNGESCILRIWCEDADNPAVFAVGVSNLSARAKTTAYVDWNVNPWTVGQRDVDTRTPNLSSIVQEVVDRPGFGGTVAFIIETSPDSPTVFPRRRAWSVDGSSADAPLLVVNTTEPSGGPSPTGEFSDGFDLFGFDMNESYDADTHTYADGTVITGDALTYLQATLAWMASPASHGDWTYTNISSRAGNIDSYQVARGLEPILGAYLSVYKLTRNPWILDRMIDAFDLTAANFIEKWAAGADYATIDGRSGMNSFDGYGGPVFPWSPYANKILYRGGGGSGWYNLTDLEYLNYIKLSALQIEFAWVLHQNRGKTSISGYNYTAKADFWGAHAESIVNACANVPLSTSNWTTNYRMVTSLDSGVKIRAAVGAYPIFRQDEGHAAFNGILAHRYLGALAATGLWSIPNASAANDASLSDADAYIANGLIPCTSSYGDALATLWSRPMGSASGSTVAQRATYTGYVYSSLVRMWLTGAYRTRFTRERLSQLANSFADMHNGTNGATYKSIIGDTDKCGLTASGTARTPAQNAQRGFCNMLVFAEGGARTKLDTVATNVMTGTAGGYTDPDSGIISAAQFVRAALVAIGDLT